MNISTARKHATKLAMPLCIAALAAPAAQAAQAGFYVGGYYGEASKDVPIAIFDADAANVYELIGFVPATRSARLDDETTTYGFQAGYRFNPHLAFEGGYMDLGSVAYREQSTGDWIDGPTTFQLNFDTRTTGFALSALGILPLSYRFEVYARAGVLLATNNYKLYLATPGLDPGRDEFSETSTELLAGVGASLSFLEIYGLRLEYQRVFDAGKASSGGAGDVDLMSLGITVTF